MLPSFKNLRVPGASAALDMLVDRATAELPPGWSRDSEGERNLNRFASRFRYVLLQWMGAEPPAAGVAFAVEQDALEIANIVPSSTHALTFAQYNSLVDICAVKILGPAAEQLGLRIEVSAGAIDLSQMLSPEAYRLLELFAETANKGTGSAHPNDRRRWLAFLVEARRDPQRPPAELLERWLTEERGWPQETSVDLAGEYEFAMDLLKVAAG